MKHNFFIDMIFYLDYHIFHFILLFFTIVSRQVTAALHHANMKNTINQVALEDSPLTILAINKIWQIIIGKKIHKHLITEAFSTFSVDDNYGDPILPYKVLENMIITALIENKTLSQLNPK